MEKENSPTAVTPSHAHDQPIAPVVGDTSVKYPLILEHDACERNRFIENEGDLKKAI